jgi:hypothetical protein
MPHDWEQHDDIAFSPSPEILVCGFTIHKIQNG